MADTSGLPNSKGSTGPASKRKRDTREIVRYAIAGVALILLIAFVVANSRTVQVGFVFFDTKISLIWVIVIAAGLGALVDRLVILLRSRRRKAKQR